MTTIYALASGALPSAIAIIRLSGDKTRHIVERLCGRVPKPRVATRALLRDPESHAILDDALILFFPAPHSFTGEDCAEFQVHGGVAVIEGIFEALSRETDVRLALPGEFTKRAVENGKFDVTIAEGLADLVAATTSAQRTHALFQSTGGFAQILDDLYADIIKPLSLCEAMIDFADESDVPQEFHDALLQLLTQAAQKLRDILKPGRLKRWLKDGFCIVLAGAPNAGKSSLLNALIEHDKAIVSPIAGTTRDAIEATFVLDGLPMRLIDTAGLHESTDVIEQEGMLRAKRWLREADLVLWVEALDAAALEPPSELEDVTAPVLHVKTKADLLADFATPQEDNIILTSVKTGAGLEALKTALVDAARGGLDKNEAFVLSRQRYFDDLSQCLASVLEALEKQTNEETRASELIAEDLRYALSALQNILRPFDNEAVLDAIFSSFCIGK